MHELCGRKRCDLIYLYSTFVICDTLSIYRFFYIYIYRLYMCVCACVNVGIIAREILCMVQMEHDDTENVNQDKMTAKEHK